ncbi:hypothetical protein KEM48_007635 [Puccinia striiformis f. sp. tritici PST-130]|uniref:HAT C-terminal dimerisation domain-containing protein n=1 Tax=Puccinia striiformis f. sp. tritici PST-78 TaxID=1165861 RepID=A0A0L0VKG3_9BASI|nr:hypothetical protein KEM48_007635 [Puccinia striiformis f. sp. tritici PST-130]KNE99768.1 hypothetical protein PSTG_07055 [Puccinia striiformis f. sp. tritici PST-78]
MAQDDEIKAYLKAVLNFKEEDLQHKTTPLKWWKANQQTYPTLATLASVVEGAFSPQKCQTVSSLQFGEKR